MSDSESNSELPSKAKKGILFQRYRKEYGVKYPVVMKSGFSEMHAACIAYCRVYRLVFEVWYCISLSSVHPMQLILHIGITTIL